MLLFKPDYYDCFRCAAGECPDSCCKEWEVEIDDASARFYRTKNRKLDDSLREVMRTADGKTSMSIIDGRCPMWRSDGLCRIQAELGESAPIAYVLYYATIITMDLNAKSKKEGEHEETISASDTKEVEEENTPQTVLEDTKTGGFSFLESTEASGNQVEEAAETEPAPAIDEGILPETTETPTDANRDNHLGMEDKSSQEDNPENDDDKEAPISTSMFHEEATSEEKQEELFYESKAFDQELTQPQYAVSSIIDNEKDAALVQRIDAINQRLVDCKTEGGLRNPMQLASEIRENREHSNIDFQDEYTQC